MRRQERASLALLLAAIFLAAAPGCGRKPQIAEPPGFADLPPVPEQYRWPGQGPEVGAWQERLRSVYRALGAKAHSELKEHGQTKFRLKDLPPEQRKVLSEYLAQRGFRDWIESKVGRPPDLNRLTFALTGSPGGAVQLVVLDLANPDTSGGLNCDYIGGWPESQGRK